MRTALALLALPAMLVPASIGSACVLLAILFYPECSIDPFTFKYGICRMVESYIRWTLGHAKELLLSWFAGGALYVFLIMNHPQPPSST